MMIFRHPIKIEFQEVDVLQVMEDLQLWLLYNIQGCMQKQTWKPKFTTLSRKLTVPFYEPLKPKLMQLLGYGLSSYSLDHLLVCCSLIYVYFFFQEKEGLITELRKELRLSNEEHRELLGKVNADDVIRRIRSNIVKKQNKLLII